MRKEKLKSIDIWGLSCYLLLDRYIIGEIGLVFLFGLGILTSLGVAIGTLSDLGNKISDFGLPIDLALQVFFWKIPEFVAYALPISLLLATLVGYGRFSNDSELIAWRSCGISIYRIVAPAMIFSCLIALITLIFNELVVPQANYRAAEIIGQVIPEEQTFRQKHDIFYPEYEKNINQNQILKSLFYANKFQDNVMKDVTILSWRQENLEKILFSKEAIWNEQEQMWYFFNGIVYEMNPNRQDYYAFKQYKMSLSAAPLELAQKSRDPFQMNIIQLMDYLKIISRTGDEKKILMFEVRTQQKIAFPFICIVFTLIGSSVGIRPQYLGRGTSLGITVMIVFLYYLLAFLVGALGLVGFVSPIMAGWLPNVFGLVVGINILVQANQ